MIIISHSAQQMYCPHPHNKSCRTTNVLHSTLQGVTPHNKCVTLTTNVLPWQQMCYPDYHNESYRTTNVLLIITMSHTAQYFHRNEAFARQVTRLITSSHSTPHNPSHRSIPLSSSQCSPSFNETHHIERRGAGVEYHLMSPTPRR